ncbi:sulfotransferase [Streptomyces sp. TRM68367]|uniref:sulfotransferase family protein n=1 Tax=Streptomyces sp. TRM68367 TaxID=2758415 RepID=UPI00165B621A|nr:sulfotransferase [Streptomyces sp. TRM68367]MBC9726828.1 sulfotransferase [Streptomyces sp. TRM68367]
MSAPSPIFVAGTGRSGTSQLANILGEHPQIHRIPNETRFIVDPGGLRDLADALTIRYDPYVGDDALRRLSDILTVRLAGRRDRDRGYTVPAAIGERHHWDAVVRARREHVRRVRACGRIRAWRLACRAVRASELRAGGPEVLQRSARTARRAVDTMFGGAAADAGKPTWCEKTPFNLLCMDFLWELVPEATIVHIKRHPVTVVASHVDQPWAPPTVDGALAWLKPVYDRWLAWEATVDLTGKRYVEVKAEDLAADWPEQRRALFELLGVDDVATRSTFQSHRLEHRKGQFDRGTREFVEQTLDRERQHIDDHDARDTRSKPLRTRGPPLEPHAVPRLQIPVTAAHGSPGSSSIGSSGRSRNGCLLRLLRLTSRVTT